MTREIYCKLPSDINYENKIETTTELEQILGQIKVVLGTKPGEVLGSYNFGIDLNKYLFSYNQTQQQIVVNINTALAAFVKYDTDKYNIYADISYGHNQGTDTSDYAVIDIVVNESKCLGVLVSQN